MLAVVLTRVRISCYYDHSSYYCYCSSCRHVYSHVFILILSTTDCILGHVARWCCPSTAHGLRSLVQDLLRTWDQHCPGPQVVARWASLSMAWQVQRVVFQARTTWNSHLRLVEDLWSSYFKSWPVGSHTPWICSHHPSRGTSFWDGSDPIFAQVGWMKRLVTRWPFT